MGGVYAMRFVPAAQEATHPHHHHCTITASALHYYCISTALLLHQHCTITASALHYYCISTALLLHQHCMHDCYIIAAYMTTAR
jgi:hypothetical protein